MVAPEDPFPEEIWLLVLSQLTNHPDDLFSCMHTYFMWNKLLFSSRTEWMFPLILRILMKHLQPQDLFICRIVCKIWRNSVDKLLVPNLHMEKYIVEELVKHKHISEMPPFVKCPLLWIQRSEIFNSTFKECPLPKNFHLFRTVRQVVEIYKEGTHLLSFLELFGQNIRELELEIKIGIPDGETRYMWFRMKTHPPTTILLHILKVLQYVPNLNYLYVVCSSEKILAGSEQESSHFLKNYTSPPPPHLPKLQILYIETQSEQINSVLLKLYASDSNLLQKVTGFHPDPDCNFIKVCKRRHKFCRTLMHYTTGLLYSLNFYEEINYFNETIHCPLKSIDLQFWGDIPNVFHMLSPILKFKNTLSKLTLNFLELPMLPKKLIIKLPLLTEYDECGEYTEINHVFSEYLTQLPQLKCLQLRIAKQYVNYMGAWVGEPLKYYLWTSLVEKDVIKIAKELFCQIWPRFKNCAKIARKVVVSTSRRGSRVYITATVQN